mmetsp:Transcript_117622/g.379650  ORF Transcript_117622/g.379650 Transcript_117622/m.379650 type:complete len:202 (-) Transcript_117622:666-1271(-)
MVPLQEALGHRLLDESRHELLHLHTPDAEEVEPHRGPGLVCNDNEDLPAVLSGYAERDPLEHRPGLGLVLHLPDDARLRGDLLRDHERADAGAQALPLPVLGGGAGDLGHHLRRPCGHLGLGRGRELSHGDYIRPVPDTDLADCPGLPDRCGGAHDDERRGHTLSAHWLRGPLGPGLLCRLDPGVDVHSGQQHERVAAHVP